MRFLRAIFVLATVVVATVATLEWTGRAVFSQLPRLEGVINDLLADQGIVLQGLEGRWRGLNPGFFADSVRFPGGEFAGFDFRLDLIESLTRNRVVARRMTVADARLVVEKTDAGWRLKGTSGDSGFPAGTFLMYSDEVWIRGRLVAEGGGRSAPLHVESVLLNSDGRHQFSIRAQSEATCTDCALTVEGDVATGGVGAIRVAARSFTLGDELAEILGLSGFEAALTGDWQRAADGAAEARLEVVVTGLETPGGVTGVSAVVSAWNERGGYRGSFERLAVVAGGREMQLAGVGLRVPEIWGDDEPFVELWSRPMPIADLASTVVAAVGTDHVAGRWLVNLAPEGRAEHLGIRVDRAGVAFTASGSDAAVFAYNGVPEVDNVSFQAFGHTRALRVDLEAANHQLAFSDFVPATGIRDRTSGSLTVVLGSDHYGMRGEWQVASEGSRGNVGLALVRSVDADDVRVTADATVDRLAMRSVKDYLPLGLEPKLRRWLVEGVLDGQLADIRLLYHGAVKPLPGQVRRRFEMTARIEDGVIDYHPDWPRASRVASSLAVTGSETRLAGRARAFDTDISDLAVRVPTDGERVEVDLRAEATVDRLIDFAWQTPVHEAMPFLSEAWVGTGRASLVAELALPLRGQKLRPADMRLDLKFRDASIDLTDLGLHIDAMDNRVGFEWPAAVASDASEGTLFGAPVSIAIDSEDDRVTFALDGTATVPDAYRLLGFHDPGIATGRFDFNARFTVFPGAERASELRVESDLAGVSVALPSPLGKAADEARELVATVQFLDDYTAAALRYGVATGWVHASDTGIRAASLGIGAPIPMADASVGRVVIGGGLDLVDGGDITAFIGGFVGDDGGVEDTVSGSETTDPLAWELRRFRIAKVVLDAVELDDLVLDGFSDGGEVSFSITSEAIKGTVARSGGEPWQVRLNEVLLDGPTADGDPLDPVLIDSLIAADVVLDRVRVGDADYGSWRFGLRPVAEGVRLVDVEADLRGLRIESTAPALWSRNGQSLFEGTVSAGDLKDVLPLWDFAPSIESESFRSSGRLSWPGSPMNFELAGLSGEARLELTNGRFLDVEQGAGATRILSLINFANIVKRISLDFSDVFGRGISFEEVVAPLTLVDGRARFPEPAKIKGTGPRFEISGNVDLVTGALDNEMVVTLPLQASLPWYAAVLALSNPAAAAGVLVGRRVFRNPIESLSSGTFHVSGTYDDPQVELVRMFDNQVDPTPADASAADESEVMSAAPADDEDRSPDPSVEPS